MMNFTGTDFAVAIGAVGASIVFFASPAQESPDVAYSETHKKIEAQQLMLKEADKQIQALQKRADAGLIR